MCPGDNSRISGAGDIYTHHSNDYTYRGPPGTPEATNDDIVFPPGGFSYRANGHQQGQPDWPPVQQTDATLWNLTRMANITYRAYIETGAGETRNNLFYLKMIGVPSLDPLKTIYEPVNLPEGFTVERGDEMSGGIGGMDKSASRIVMKINIARNVASGEYSFQFKVTVDGAEFGSLPCTVKVVPDTVTPQPISSLPPPKTDWEKGSPPPAGIGGWQQPRPLTEYVYR